MCDDPSLPSPPTPLSLPPSPPPTPLSLPPSLPPSLAVMVGVLDTAVSVVEGETASVRVNLTQGMLGRDLEIGVVTMSISATGKLEVGTVIIDSSRISIAGTNIS